MARRFRETDPVKCWNLLAEVLSYGHTIPFWYKKSEVTYRLTEGNGWGLYYQDDSSAEYILDDIQFALFDQGLKEIRLFLSGKEDGPISDFWYFTFTKAGLVLVEYYYNDD
jgi:hypothetical protein